jgi:hypothetical protein
VIRVPPTVAAARDLASKARDCNCPTCRAVLSRESAKTFWGNEFDQSRVHPGDTIVVPEKTYRGKGVRTLLDFSQLFSSIALGAGALAVITN